MAATKSKTSTKGKTLVAVMLLFFTVYVGLEATCGMYFTTYSVISKVNLSKVDGAYVTAVYYGSFALTR